MPDSTRINLDSSESTATADNEVDTARQRIEDLKSNRSRIFSSSEVSTEVPLVQAAATTESDLGGVNLNDQAAITSILQQNTAAKKDVSAVTVGRMLGLVTSAEFQLLQGQLDLLSTRINSAISKLDKLNSNMINMPTGSDLERIDVQLGAIKQLLQENFGGDQKNATDNFGSGSLTSTKILSSED